jgi:hypothetical protein
MSLISWVLSPPYVCTMMRHASFSFFARKWSKFPLLCRPVVSVGSAVNIFSLTIFRNPASTNCGTSWQDMHPGRPEPMQRNHKRRNIVFPSLGFVTFRVPLKAF